MRSIQENIGILYRKFNCENYERDPPTQNGFNTRKGYTLYLSLCSLKIWQVETGDPVQTIAHSAPVTCVGHSTDSEFTVTGSEDMSLKVWESATGKLTQVMTACGMLRKTVLLKL